MAHFWGKFKHQILSFCIHPLSFIEEKKLRMRNKLAELQEDERQFKLARAQYRASLNAAGRLPEGPVLSNPEGQHMIE